MRSSSICELKELNEIREETANILDDCSIIMPTLNWIGKDKGLEVHEALQKADKSDNKLGLVPMSL